MHKSTLYANYRGLKIKQIQDINQGCGFILLLGSGSRGIKLREKQSSTNKVFFVGNYNFFKSEPKNVANVYG